MLAINGLRDDEEAGSKHSSDLDIDSPKGSIKSEEGWKTVNMMIAVGKLVSLCQYLL
jgi:hypothetical protein